MSAGNAQAAIRSGTDTDGIDNQDTSPTLNERPPTMEVTTATVSYDEAGSVTATVSFNQPPGQYEGQTASIDVSGAKTCATGSSPGTPVPKLEIELVGHELFASAPPKSSAKLHGFDGRVTTPTQVSDDGKTISATFSHPQFANRDYRCFAGYAPTDDFGVYFDGFEPPGVSVATATETATAELARRYGDDYTGTPSQWLKCPKEELYDKHLGCEFRFRQGDHWRGGSLLVSDVYGYPTITYFSHYTFTRELQTCPIHDSKHGWDDGYFISDRQLRFTGGVAVRKYCAELVGGAGMAGDLEYIAPSARHLRRTTAHRHGTNGAGFEEDRNFRCRVGGHGDRYVFDCKNALGDRFLYAFTVHRPRPKPKPPPPHAQRSCNPNYGGCLKPNASDYDCAGGSGDGPYYTGPVRVTGYDEYDLDRDGDGIGCNDS